MFTRRLLFIALILLFIPFLGIKEFYSRGEAREALVAQSMMLSGNYLLPESYNQAVPSKPPLLHWMIQGAYVLVGDLNEFAARLPSALAALCGAFLFFQFLSTRVDRGHALLAVAVLATNVQWFRNGTSTRVDLVLSVAMLWGLLSLYRWWEQRLVGYPWQALFALTAAALTKGPIGIALPCGIFGLFLLTQRHGVLSSVVACLKVALPALLLSLFWYGACYVEFGDRFLDKVYYENVARLTSTMEDEPHKHGPLYLFGTLFLGLMPWVLPALGGLRRFSFKKIIDYVKVEPLHMFCALWLVSFVLFFSIPSSKRDTYLLPAYAPAAFFVAVILHRYAMQYASSLYRCIQAVAVLLCASSVALLCAPSSVAAMHPYISMLIEFRDLHMLAVLCAVVIASSLIVVTKSIDSDEDAFMLTSYVWIAALIVVEGIIAPAYANAISYRPLSDEVRTLVADQQTLYSFEDEFYGVSFYLKKPFLSVSTDEAKNVAAGVIFVYENNLETLQAKLRQDQCLKTLLRSSRPVVKEDRYVLVTRVDSCNTIHNEL
jgi:4-amino-4-deoxy-L-arabinose transferase-like glycosyltransferase